MNRLVATLCSVGMVAGVVAGQNYTVFPSDHTGTPPNATIPGGTYENYAPFSYGIARQMIYYDAWDVQIPNGRAISKIGFVCNQGSTLVSLSSMSGVEPSSPSQ